VFSIYIYFFIVRKYNNNYPKWYLIISSYLILLGIDKKIKFINFFVLPVLSHFIYPCKQIPLGHFCCSPLCFCHSWACFFGFSPVIVVIVTFLRLLLLSFPCFLRVCYYYSFFFFWLESQDLKEGRAVKAWRHRKCWKIFFEGVKRS